MNKNILDLNINNELTKYKNYLINNYNLNENLKNECYNTLYYCLENNIDYVYSGLIGTIYEILGTYNEALIHYKQYLNIDIKKSCSDLGFLYKKLRDTDNCYKYFLLGSTYRDKKCSIEILSILYSKHKYIELINSYLTYNFFEETEMDCYIYMCIKYHYFNLNDQSLFNIVLFSSNFRKNGSYNDIIPSYISDSYDIYINNIFYILNKKTVKDISYIILKYI